MKCERCGREGLDIEGAADNPALCHECLTHVVMEWRIRPHEFGQLAGEENEPPSWKGQ